MSRPMSQHVSVGGHSSKHNLDKSYRAELEHVDPALSDLNVTLKHDGLKAVYTELFGQAVKDYNAKQKRAGRKIESYYERVRDDARGHKGVQNKDGKRLAYEQVVGIGNRKTFHASDPANVELAKAVYADYLKEFEVRYPHLRVFEAVIHMDEPEGGIHMHLAYVPWGEGYKRGMERQQSLSKACENMGFSHMELDSRCRSMLEEVCKRHGIERLDMDNHEHHKPTPQFKREQRELERVQAQVAEQKAELAQIEQKAGREFSRWETNYAAANEAAKKAAEALKSRDEALKQANTLENKKDGLEGEISTLERELAELKVYYSSEVSKTIAEQKKESDTLEALKQECGAAMSEIAHWRELKVSAEQVSLDVKPLPFGYVSVKSEDLAMVQEQARAYCVNRDDVDNLRDWFQHVEQREFEVEQREEAVYAREHAANEAMQEAQELYWSQANINETLGETRSELREVRAELTKTQKLVGELRGELAKAKETISGLQKTLSDAWAVLASTVKAVGMLKYDQQDGYAVPELHPKAGRLVDAIASYAAKWLRTDGRENLAKEVESRIGLSPGIQSEIDPPRRAKERSSGHGAR